ncbi:hypothetical protein NE237_000190 [Protea cynaroides]|uniref:WPP domain-interacting protein 2 n=1 Tax=Protea cynaroides TaxID=273540 RepID=A0A9Q0KRQ2_9MAGN|nr:hypothetical protein NE237_000190 [Protea cynaroides]
MLDLVMDLSESESSAYIPAKDKEEAPEDATLPLLDGINAENNGSCGNEVVGLGCGEHVEIKSSPEEPNPPNGKAIGIGIEEHPVEPQRSSTSSTTVESPSPPPSRVTLTPSPTSSTPKGYGLKKWRRIRRDFPKDGSSDMDLNRILKRGLSIVAEPTRPRDASAEIKPKREGSVASANSSVKSLPVPSVSAIKGSTSDSRLAAGSAFPVCTDSENSEDRSSKSSTAASAPKLRYDVPLSMGGSSSSRDKSKIKSLSGKTSSSAVHKVHQGKSRIETSKKPRAGRIKVEEENSYSSQESDSRSSNALFAQMESFSQISNGRQSKKLSNYDGENSDGAHISEMHSSEEVQTHNGKENGIEVEDVSQDDVAADASLEVKEEKNDNHRPTIDQDPLAISVNSLLSVQESLEREIEKFVEIGWENVFLADESVPSHRSPAGFASVDPETCELNSSGPLCFEEIKPSSLPLEAQSIELEQSISHAESNPEGASAVLKAKENIGESLKEESGRILKSPREFRQIEVELEDLIKQKMEAEVEYLVITRSTENLKVASADRISLIEEQKSLVGEQTQMLQKLRDAESNAMFLKSQAEELEASCGKLLGIEEVLGMQNGVCKLTFCFLIQLILLFVALGIFLLLLLPHSSGFVPT